MVACVCTLNLKYILPLVWSHTMNMEGQQLLRTWGYSNSMVDHSCMKRGNFSFPTEYRKFIHEISHDPLIFFNAHEYIVLGRGATFEIYGRF